MKPWELEQMTLDFLRQNDPAFLDKSRSRNLEYPYLSERQTKCRAAKEIPLSNLSTKQKMTCPKFSDMDIYEQVNW